MNRLQIAEELLGHALEEGYAPCPGQHLHTKANGRKDFRVVLDGAPTGYCFHGKCSDLVADFNKELRRRIWFAENDRGATPARGHWGEGVVAAPKAEKKARPELDQYAVWELTRGVPEVDEGWLARHSPVDVKALKSGDFLNHLYHNGERVLIFTDQRSQGDFLWQAGVGKWAGSYRLAQQRAVRAVQSALPSGGKDGAWFLVQPVTGQWAVKRDVTISEAGAETQGMWTRRSQNNVTAYRYFVLESDELLAADWLKVVVNLPLPIAAIYTSAGRSIHALVRIEMAGKAEWDAMRNELRQIVCPLGADPAALSAVRLSRLPGCYRGERLQRLLYLNPKPEAREIRLTPEVRA